MSQITLPTRQLVLVLTDAIATAARAPDVGLMSTVLLSTDRGDWLTYSSPEDKEGEPLVDTVESDLLIATSTDGVSVVGQCYTAVTGTFHRPALISRVDAEAVVKVFKKLINSLDRKTTHKTVVELDGANLRFYEDKFQVPGGVELLATTIDATDYRRDLPGMLQPDPTSPVYDNGTLVERSYGMGVNFPVFQLFGAIGKRRKAPVAVYACHQHRPVIVEIGTNYRGLWMPYRLKEDEGQHLAPQNQVFEPALPETDHASEQPALTGV
jgi:hypothetical protein